MLEEKTLSQLDGLSVTMVLDTEQNGEAMTTQLIKDLQQPIALELNAY